MTVQASLKMFDQVYNRLREMENMANMNAESFYELHNASLYAAESIQIFAMQQQEQAAEYSPNDGFGADGNFPLPTESEIGRASCRERV